MCDFQHEHFHMGHPLNKLADALAKAAALNHYSAPRPAIPPPQLYDATHPLAEWLWLTDLPPDRKQAFGLPPADGNYIPCPIQIPPTRDQLKALIQPTTDTTAVTRTISGGFLTFNCCSLKDNDAPEDYQGVTPYPGKAFLLQQQFADKNVLVAGL